MNGIIFSGFLMFKYLNCKTKKKIHKINLCCWIPSKNFKKLCTSWMMSIIGIKLKCIHNSTNWLKKLFRYFFCRANSSKAHNWNLCCYGWMSKEQENGKNLLKLQLKSDIVSGQVLQKWIWWIKLASLLMIINVDEIAW